MRNLMVMFCWLLGDVLVAANYGDVVFSELMVDPEPCVGLPSVEYVELCNRSASSISLNGWFFLYGGKSYPIPTCTLGSGEYVLLCAKLSVGLFPIGTPVLGMATFPALVNGGKLMGLVSANSEVVSCLEYSDAWYRSGFKANGGWSLECIDLSNFSGLSSNWTASDDVSGGTPGRRNSVSAVNPSLERPLITRIFVPNAHSVELHFSTFMQASCLSNILNYTVSPEQTLVLSAQPEKPDLRVVTLQLSDSLVSKASYELHLTSLSDVSGNVLNDTVLAFGLPETPEPGDLQINEILFNPLPGGCDYVEFVNVGEHCVDLSQVWLTNRSAEGVLNAGRQLCEKPLPSMPGSYWLLSESTDSVCAVGPFPRMPNAIELKGFPSMPDDAGTIALVTTSAEIVDELTYTDGMHFALLTNADGVALEKICPEAPTAIASNWVSANATVHFGTPGFENSQFRTLQYKGVNGFYTRQTWMTPNNDGLDDRVCIQFEFAEACAGSLRIFDLRGRLVRFLANNEPLGMQGSYDWDGLRDDGSLAAGGRYILLAEAFTPKGRVIRNRLVLTILF